MFSVVAPASTATWTTWSRNSIGVLVASCGLNSTSSHSSPARATEALVASSTWSELMRSMCSMWLGLVDRNTWMRECSASLTASKQRSTSPRLARDSPAMVAPWTVRAISRTASKSPWLATGKPASMTSTPRRASCSAISSLALAFRLMPGACSPSLRVVSKMTIRSDNGPLLWSRRFPVLRAMGDLAVGRPAQSRPTATKGQEARRHGDRPHHAPAPGAWPGSDRSGWLRFRKVPSWAPTSAITRSSTPGGITLSTVSAISASPPWRRRPTCMLAMFTPAWPRMVPTLPIGVTWADGGAGDAHRAAGALAGQSDQVHPVLARAALGLGDLDAALGRQQRRVHEGDRLAHHRREQALQSGQIEHPGVLVGQPADVVDVQAARAERGGAAARPAAGQRGEDATGLGDQRQEGPPGVRHRPGVDVDGVGDELAGQRQQHLLGDGHPCLVLRLGGGGPQVRGYHHVVQAEQRAGGGRLLGEHVQGGAGEVAGLHRLGQRGLVHDPAAGGVDQARARLDRRQLALTEQPDRLRCLGQVDG